MNYCHLIAEGEIKFYKLEKYLQRTSHDSFSLTLSDPDVKQIGWLSLEGLVKGSGTVCKGNVWKAGTILATCLFVLTIKSVINLIVKEGDSKHSLQKRDSHPRKWIFLTDMTVIGCISDGQVDCRAWQDQCTTAIPRLSWR